MNEKADPPQEPQPAAGATGRSIVRRVVWFGLFVAALCAILMAATPERYGGFDVGRSLPRPTIETFAAIVVMMLAIVGVVQLARRPAQKSGISAYAVVLAIGAAALWWLPQWSGIIAVAAFIVLIAGPYWLAPLARRHLMAGRRRHAAVYWRLATWLHPSGTMRFYAALLRAGALPSTDAEVAAYASLKQGATAERAAVLDCCAAMARDDWTSVLAQSRGVPALKWYELRALGELGHVDEMIAAFLRWRPKPRGGDLAQCWLYILAFAGRREGVRALLQQKLRFMTADTTAYWCFVAASTAGVADGSRQALADHARASDDGSFRRAAQRRLAAAVRPAAPILSPGSSAVVADIERALGGPTG